MPSISSTGVVPEIRLDDACILTGGGGRAVENHLAMIKDRYRVDQIEEEVQMMLDQQDRHAVAMQAAQEIAQLVQLGVGESCRRLIEYQRPRLRRQRSREVQHALLPVGHGARQRVAMG